MVLFSFYCSFSLFLPPSSVSLSLSLYSEPSFYSKPHSHSSPFTSLLGAISDLFGAELRECRSKKEGKKRIRQVPHNYAGIKLILTHYPCVLLAPKCSSQFLRTHIRLLASPRPPNKRVRNHRSKLGKRGKCA